MFNAVFFDLDGTLVNSLFDLANAVNQVLSDYGYPTHEVNAYKYFVGDGIPKMIERALPADNATPEKIAEVKEKFMAYYSKHYIDYTVPYDGIVQLVTDLKAKGIKLAVVTNKAQIMAEKIVSELFGDLFDCVLGMREGVPAKPDPTGIFMVMDELSVKPNECAFVGDTGMDVAAGVNAGAFPIGVLWGFREKDELIKFGAKAFAANSKELSEIIMGN